MKIFFDTEFTGLHQATTLISIGMVSETGMRFYAEFTDYDKTRANDWIQNNVINKLWLEESNSVYNPYSNFVTVIGTKDVIKQAIKDWICLFTANGNVEFWSDCLAYDWVLFNGLIADYSNGYPVLPNGVNYIPFDISTLFHVKGIDPDVKREEFAMIKDSQDHKHTAIHDAIVIKACYDRLTRQPTI